jgi:transcriptional regulator with GAF, ATPase, and Fis domain
MLSMDSFVEAIGRRPGAPEPVADDERSPFAGLTHLPTFGEALELLAQEAMARAGGNQTLAARLLGITQPALSKRLKRWRR